MPDARVAFPTGSIGIGFALLITGPVLMALSTALVALPHDTSGCYPDGSGGEICYASTGPGPMGPVAGILFLAGLAVPGVGLLVLGMHAVQPSTRVAFLAGGISLLAAVSAIVAFVFLLGTL